MCSKVRSDLVFHFILDIFARHFGLNTRHCAGGFHFGFRNLIPVMKIRGGSVDFAATSIPGPSIFPVVRDGLSLGARIAHPVVSDCPETNPFRGRANLL